MTPALDTTLRPDNWDDYIGQAALKHRLDAHIAAALADHRPLEHILLDGPPGSGKTTIADVIAARLGDNIEHLSRPVSARQLVAIIIELDMGILFIDEIQMWSKRQQEDLLGLLENGEITTDWGGVKAPCVSVIAATTEREKLTPALEDRFLVQTWEPYTNAQLAAIADGMAERAGVTLAEGITDGIAAAACGSPRACRKLVFAARALSHVEGAVTIDAILDHAQLDPDGLGRLELDYLSVLRRHGQPVGMEVIADTLAVHRTRVRTAERLLVDRGLVMRTKAGRILTAEGRRRIATRNPTPSRLRTA